jgi:hypothetical protein
MERIHPAHNRTRSASYDRCSMQGTEFLDRGAEGSWRTHLGRVRVTQVLGLSSAQWNAVIDSITISWTMEKVTYLFVLPDAKEMRSSIALPPPRHMPHVLRERSAWGFNRYPCKCMLIVAYATLYVLYKSMRSIYEIRISSEKWRVSVTVARVGSPLSGLRWHEKQSDRMWQLMVVK